MLNELPCELIEHVYCYVHISRMQCVFDQIRGFRKSRLNASKGAGRRSSARGFRWVNLLVQVKDFEDALGEALDDVTFNPEIDGVRNSWERVLTEHSNIPDAIYTKCCGGAYGDLVVDHVRVHGTLPPPLRNYLVYNKTPVGHKRSFIRGSERRHYVHRWHPRFWEQPGNYGTCGPHASWAYYNGVSGDLCDLSKSMWDTLGLEMDLLPYRRGRRNMRSVEVGS